MFRVYVINQGEEYPLYEPLDDELRIYDPVLTQEMGRGGMFKFCIYEDHPYASKMELLKSEIIVYRDDKEIYRGRILIPEYNMKKLISITVEGDLCYFNDSQQAPYSITGGVSDFINTILDVHNSQVDDFKKVYPGIITVADTAPDVTRSEKKYKNTWETLCNQLVKEIGGFLRIRNEGGKKYLDYLWDYGGFNEQVIRFGENLLDIKRHIDAMSIVTCLIPIGANLEYADDLGEQQVRQIDITSVNDGKNYIQNDAGIEQYGKIWGTKTWKDVTEPDKLLEKAREHLNNLSGLLDTIEISAIDLSLIDESAQEFELGKWTTVSSPPHGIDKQMILRKRVINLSDPTGGSITLGKSMETFVNQTVSGQQDAMTAVDKASESASDEIKRKVENATNLITGGLGGYVILDTINPQTGKKEHPWRILIMDAPDKDEAKNVIQINQNGLGFSTDGINGPYGNAWTIDGNLVADFITAGTMLADRIRGGILEVGGSGLGRDGKIVVKDIQDREIGYWDKTGLHVYEGVIEGTDIIGGTIDIGQGTFTVDRDGNVGIDSGEINVGPVRILEKYADLGAFRVSGAQDGILYSHDKSIQIMTDAWGNVNYPTIELSKGNDMTRITNRSITTPDIYLSDSWADDWTLVAMLKDLYRRVRALENLQ